MKRYIKAELQIKVKNYSDYIKNRQFLITLGLRANYLDNYYIKYCPLKGALNGVG